ncbi:MAG: hypothetical protein DRJ65_00385 [Acidobacteria bacterium]|nr:MAG: hypothetical protein DRJ65_00385 [Acidobacteriota bacterium]
MKVRISLWLLSFVMIVVIFPLPSGSATAVDEWNATGPGGGAISTLVRDPDNPQVVYGGTSGGSTFKSTDDGVSWSRLSGLPATVRVIIFDPADHASIYAGAANGLYSSHDGGATWTAVGSELSSEQVYSLVIPLSAQQNMLAGTRNGVFRSTDGGETWVPANTGLDGTIILALAADPSAPEVVFAGTLYHGIYKTTDGGANWTETANGLSGSAVYCIAIDGSNPNRLYAGTWNGGVFVSTNGGADWAAAGTELGGAYVPALAIDPASPHAVYAGTEGGVWISADGGAAWLEQTVDQPFDVVSAITLGQSGGVGMLIGTNGAGVFRSADGGAHWGDSNAGLIASRILSLAVPKGHSDTVYAGCLGGGGIYRSDNRGLTWARASSGLGNGTVRALAADPYSQDTVYAGTLRGIYRTGNGGISWMEASGGLFPYSTVNSISVGGPDPGIILAGTNDGVFRSTDRASSWSPSSSGLSDLRIEEVAISSSDPTRAYAGTNDDGVFRSDDGGLSWIAASSGLDAGRIRSLAVDPLDPDTAFAGMVARVFKTTDGGQTWAEADSGLPSRSIDSLVFDPANPSFFYAGSTAVFRTDDGGADWSAVGSWGSSPWVEALALDPIDGRTVYAGSYGAGVQVLTLPGRPLWVPVVTHAPGLNGSSWRSDVWVLNPGDENTTVLLRFHGSGGSIEDSYVLPGNSQAAFTDVVDLLGGNGSGALEVISDATVFAASRTYNISGGGTFGQSYPATEINQALLLGESAVLPHLAEEEDFRTNIGLVNIGGTPATAALELFDGLGTLLAKLEIPLQPGEWRLEVRPYLEEAGVTDLHSGWARVSVQDGDGIVALGSVIDNISGDPTSVIMAEPPASSGGAGWIPEVTHVPGLHQSQWRSDVALLNTGEQTSTVTLRYHGNGGTLSMQENIGAGTQEVLGDIVDSFGVSGSGALEVTSTQAVVISSRTYNLSPEGTFGQSHTGVHSGVALATEESGYLLGLAENSDFRTNIGFTNLSTGEATVGIELFTGAGEKVAEYSVELAAGEWRLEIRPYAALAGLTDLDQGFARVTLESGKVIVALASVVDNRTNDPTTVALVR